MKHRFDDILFNALSPDCEPPQELNDEILRRAFQTEKRTPFRIRTVMLAACLILALGSVTALAAWRYLTLKQVASSLHDSRLAEAFLSEGAVSVSETQVCGNYRITLLGVVSGEDISDYHFSENGAVQSDRFYAVTAIERADGTPMPDTDDPAYGDEDFLVSPYVSGLDPMSYNIITFGGGYSEFVENGVEYRLIDTGNVSGFADRTVYIGVSDGTFYKKGPFLYDENTGGITRNEEYDGVNALFVLPLDPALADGAAAQKLIDSADAKLSGPNKIDAGKTGTDKTDTDKTGSNPQQAEAAEAASEWYAQFMDESGTVNKKKLEELCRVLPETVGTFAPDADGVYHFSWESESYGGGSGSSGLKYLFPENSPAGTIVSLGYSYSDGDLSTLCMETLTLNEDGTVTLAVYVPIRS